MERENIETKGLTSAQLQIAKEILKSRPNREIAKDFHVQEKTVKSHITCIFKKTGVKRRKELIARFYDPACEQPGPIPTAT